MSRFWPRLRALVTLSAIVGVAWAMIMMGWVVFSMVRGRLPLSWMWKWIVNTAPLIFFIGLGFGTAFIAALATLRPKDGGFHSLSMKRVALIGFAAAALAFIGIASLDDGQFLSITQQLGTILGVGAVGAALGAGLLQAARHGKELPSAGLGGDHAVLPNR